MSALQLNKFRLWLGNPQRQPLLMGILNITPDSFSDGGRYHDPQKAVAAGLEMLEAGAEMLDIGGESTRPGAVRVGAEEQIRRLRPVLQGLCRGGPIPISIDTPLAEVAQMALDEGAAIINDVSAGRDDPQMFNLLAKRQAPMVLMHMLGQPATMQLHPVYDDVVAEVKGFLLERIEAAMNAGIDRSLLIIDPGIGFGKTLEHNIQLLRNLDELKSIGLPLLVGVSRKKFLGTLTGQPAASQRGYSTAAAVAFCLMHGADIVRVHDVPAMRQVMQVISALRAE